MNSTNLSPEYVNQNSTGATIVQCTAITALATFFVALRFFTRVWRKVRLGWDDWLILLALVTQWGCYVLGALYNKSGAFGRHIIVVEKTNPQGIVKMELYFFIGDLLYASVLAFTKFSILVFYCRMFPTKFMKWAASSVGSIVAIWWLVVIFVSVFRCHPIRKTWDPFTPGTCLDTTKIFVGKAVPNFTTDFIILLLPLVELSKLNARWPQKIALAGVFMLGALACISSVWRFVEVKNLSKQQADITYALPGILLWTTVEPCTGIISACLPLLRPLLTWVLDATGISRLVSSKEKKKRVEPKELVTIGGSGDKKRLQGDSLLQSTHNDSRTVAEGSMEQLSAFESIGSGTTAVWVESHNPAVRNL